MKEYGKLFMRARRRAGISREELARRIGATVNSVRLREMKTDEPGIYVTIAYADALGISIDQLLDRPPHRPAKTMTPQEWREESWMSRRELAKRAGMCTNTVRNFENGVNTSTYNVELLADALGLGVDEYVGHAYPPRMR